LTEYQSSSVSAETGTSGEAETNVNNKITSLLDDNQKASFESVKSDWWNDVKEKLGQSEVPPQIKDDQNKDDQNKDMEDNSDLDNQGTE
jgi:hypothetical protein